MCANGRLLIGTLTDYEGCYEGPLLIIIYINHLDVNIRNASFIFLIFLTDTVIYCSAPKLHQAVTLQQSAFNVVQQMHCC